LLEKEEAFKSLHPRLREVIRRYGYVSPTPIQRKAIALILEGKNTIISAPTGSGKTEAALFPVFSKMLENANWKGRPLLVYVTPTRALNRDIFIRMREISNEIGLRSLVRHGDSSRKERREFNEGEFHWFITTPESFSMLLTHPASREALSDIRLVVVDEVHELIESERGSMLSLSLERLRRRTGGFQFIAISATIPRADLVKKLFSCYDCHLVKDDGKKSIRIETHSLSACESCSSDADRMREIIAHMRSLVDGSKNSLIFTNTRDTAEFLAYKFREAGYSDIEVHHGSLSVDTRKRVEERLKQGSLKAVIATSSLELGIDIGSVDLVIQYNSPRQSLRMIQRVGRSGHGMGRESRGIIFSPHDIIDMLESVVIARRTMAGEFEDLSVPAEPLDVLLHQILGMVLSGEAKRTGEIARIVRKSYPFRDTSDEVVEALVQFASNIGLLKVTESGEIVPGRRARGYYYSTTMIPDTRKIDVYMVSGEKVGSLDADFVFSKLEEESTFILSGREWRVVSIEDDRIIVEEVEEHRGLPPSWMGDLIPVSRSVARETVALLRRICLGESFERIRKEYTSITKSVYENVKKVCEEHAREFTIPHQDHLLIEKGDSMIVIHIPLGTKGNFTLSMLMNKYIASRMGKRIKIVSDPYKIFIESSSEINEKHVEEALMGLSLLSNYELEDMLKDSLKNSSIFSYKILQVARKMGALSEDFSLKDSKKILRYYKDTPAGEEALRELIFEKTDIEAVESLLSRIRDGSAKIYRQTKNGLSPITLQSMRGELPISYTYEGIPKEIGIKILERRVLEKEVILKCLSCGFEKKTKVKDVPEIVKCERCGSRAVAPLPPGNQVFLNAVRAGVLGKKLVGKDKEYFEDAVRRANLVVSHGKHAVFALTPYGVGPRGAARALSKLKLGWEEFLRALYEEERNFMKNRKYWD